MIGLFGTSRTRVRALGTLIAATVALLVAVIGTKQNFAQSAATRPMKMKLETSGKDFRINEPVEFLVTCLDGDNRMAPVKQDYPVRLRALLPSGKADTMTVTIPAGQAAQKTSMKFSESGIVHMQARHDRLLTGETFLRVKSGEKPRSSAPREKSAQSMSTFGTSSQLSSVAPHLLALRYSPQRTILADGKDQATIQAFVLSNEDSNASEIRVRLFNSGGNMAPQPLVIPAGQDVGSAVLTSQDVQNVTVEYVSAAPPAQLQGEAQIQISFGPPVTQLELDASPPVITLVDKSDLIIKLLDGEGKPVATDVPRKVSFTITAGRGDIETKELTIAAGGFEARTSFRPTWRGEVKITAATPNLQTAEESVNVTLPVLVLILSALGAAAGGLIAFWLEKERQWWRIVLGLVTGFVLYWAFVFGVLPLISREIVLNPLSAFAISVIGGWLGTEVFSMILKRLGLIKATT